MIVKILQKSVSFKAVRYNTDKVDRDKGELLLVENFGILQGIENLRPQDYINYLEALSSRNSRIKYPQFHVAISTKGRSHSKSELATIAQQWMEGMGYGKQPYLLIFHKDTNNNHIHIVSSRVGRDGKKIADAYEKIRAYRILNQILGMNESNTLTHDLQNALTYSFTTRKQFALLLEIKGYSLSEVDPVFKISKDGSMLDEIDLSKVDTAIAERKNNIVRIAQIRAMIYRHLDKYDNKLQLIDGIYCSPLSSILHEKFGLQIFFHGKDGKEPYGYTLIDHTAKSVFKGGEIMPLHEFISQRIQSKEGMRDEDLKKSERIVSTLVINQPADSINAATLLNSSGSSLTVIQENLIQMPASEINISDDVDDEAVHGRRRRGKQKSGSITR